eukprot:scaffold1569_cov171-Amphora_coffeaeformis.AAC.26
MTSGRVRSQHPRTNWVRMTSGRVSSRLLDCRGGLKVCKLLLMGPVKQLHISCAISSDQWLHFLQEPCQRRRKLLDHTEDSIRARTVYYSTLVLVDSTHEEPFERTSRLLFVMLLLHSMLPALRAFLASTHYGTALYVRQELINSQTCLGRVSTFPQFLTYAYYSILAQGKSKHARDQES